MNDKDSLDLNLFWDNQVPDKQRKAYSPGKPTRLEDYIEFLEATGALKNPPREATIYKEIFHL